MARVALIGDNSIEYVDLLLDIWNTGDCAVLIDWRVPPQTAYEMMCKANVSKCYIERQIFSKIQSEDYKSIQFEAYENYTTTAKEIPNYVHVKFRENYSRDEAVIIYSSRTTGKSKGVILSHYAINTNDVINIDAHKIYPSSVEKQILENNNVSACVVGKCAFNGTETLGCLYVSDIDCTPRIIQHLKFKLMPYEIPKRYVRIAAIPCNIRGKVNRSEVNRILSLHSDERP